MMLLRRICMAAAVSSMAPVLAWAAGPDNDGPDSSASGQRRADLAANLASKGIRAYALVNRKGRFEFNKGFQSLRTPATGVYCLKPSDSLNLDLDKIAPSITVEWGLSSGNNLSAFYHQLQEGCKKSEIEVLTFSFKAGENSKFSDDVSFVISVP